VAIKVIPLAREAEFRTQIEANFLREAKSAGAMSHPSIVTIYDAGKTDAFAYIAMERLHGQDLHEYLAGGNRMSARQAASMMMRLADAIHYANKRGLVHRDIKPSNIFLSRDLRPKLLDFGTALAPAPLDASENGTRHLVGTPNYMSPEQAKGEPLDARSDIFSLGTILYELLAGRRAFAAARSTDPRQVIAAVRSGHFRPRRRAGATRSCHEPWAGSHAALSEAADFATPWRVVDGSRRRSSLVPSRSPAATCVARG
jgi:serine/threonine-protein kinase